MSGTQGQAPVPGDGTRAVRAGLPEPVKYEPTLPGPVFAAHYHLPGEPTGAYTYGRDENPTWTHLERAIGSLEAPGEDDVETLVFASGMAATANASRRPTASPKTIPSGREWTFLAKNPIATPVSRPAASGE